MKRTLIAIWREQIVILHRSWLCTEVEFANGDRYLSAELGPISDFEIIGEL